MRTPNCNCIICNKAVYRRPSELKKVNFVCCIGCRSEAYKRFPNENMLKNLELGREKGTNHLEGISKSIESNEKRSESHKLFYKNNPEVAKERGEKSRAENHYNWKGGVSQLNQSIRVLDENRKWQNKVKDRDNRVCVECGSIKNLESHHIVSLSKLIEKYNITNRDEGRNCVELWDINNGITLCQDCHYIKHGRKRKNENIRTII